MEPNEHDPTATKRHVWLLCLFVAHVLIAVALGAIVRLGGYHRDESLPLRLFVGLIFAQMCLVAIWAGLGRHLRFGGFGLGPFPAILIVYLVLIVVSCALIGIVSPWAMLRDRFLVVRGVIFLAVAVAVAWGMAALEWRIREDFLETFVFWLVVHLTQAIVLIVSLLVVRSRGYRLMRLPRGASRTGAG